MRRLLEKNLPIYIRFWPTQFWLAVWSAPSRQGGETDWKALRITIRRGRHHSLLVAVIKAGTI